MMGHWAATTRPRRDMEEATFVDTFDRRVGKGIDSSIPAYVGLADPHARRGAVMLMKQKEVPKGEETSLRFLKLDSAVGKNARRANEDSRTWVRRLTREPSRYFAVENAQLQA